MAEAGMTPVERGIEAALRIDPPPTRVMVMRCPRPEHEDKVPSCKHYPDGHWYCFSCDSWGSALDMYALKRGLTIAQALRELGAYDPDCRPVRRPGPRNVYLPAETRQLLVASREFSERWEAAKLLAQLEPAQAKRDVVMSWDRLEPLDIPELLRLAALIRGVALFRHANPAKAHEAGERARAVKRLLAEVE